MRRYKFEKDEILVFQSGDMKEIEKNIEEIFQINEKILPKSKEARILMKPNFNNDLNALTGNSTDLRIIVAVLKSLKKRRYNNIVIADGPNCGIDHIGIDVFSRLCIDKIAKMFDVELKNFNYDDGEIVEIFSGKAEIAKTCLDCDFLINLPKLKTHVEAGVTLSCKNLMGCIKGVEKRKMHDSLHKNIVRLNEIIKSDLIIVDGIIGMEGRGPGDGIPKKVGVIIMGHNPYLVDLLCARLMGQNYARIGFLREAFDKGYITKKDEEIIKNAKVIASFKLGYKTLFDKILLNNFFIGIRFSPLFERFFNRGPIPWLLFKIGVKQDKYIFDDLKIGRLYEKKDLGKSGKEKLKKCLDIFCPIGEKKVGGKKCIKCMYCYQISPGLIGFDGKLGGFKMQIDRFGKFVKENG